MNQELYRQKADELIGQIARFNLDGECPTCYQDGNKPNPECSDHEVYEQEIDDALETLAKLVTRARELRRMVKP